MSLSPSTLQYIFFVSIPTVSLAFAAYYWNFKYLTPIAVINFLVSAIGIWYFCSQ